MNQVLLAKKIIKDFPILAIIGLMKKVGSISFFVDEKSILGTHAV